MKNKISSILIPGVISTTIFLILPICGILLFAAASCSQREKIIPRQVFFPDISRGSVKVMTFNIRYGSADDGDNSWAYRKEGVFDILADYSLDIIGLQEALYFQIKEIQQALPQYDIISAGRNDGKRQGETCPILYRSDRFSAADSGTFWFSNTPWKPGSKHWGNDLPRICTWARLTEVATGKSFYVYNLHLDHESENSRQYSVNLLAHEIAKRPYPEPVIVMGDFNMGSDAEAMAAIRGGGGIVPSVSMADVWQSLHPDQPNITTFHAFGQWERGPCLDHIFVNEAVGVDEVVIDARTFDGLFPSDHFPVIAWLRVYDRE